MMKQKYLITVIKRSCITGRPVWLYHGFSKSAARVAYERACMRELNRVKNWEQTTARGVSALRRLLNHCLGDMPLTAELTEHQRQAVKWLQDMEKDFSTCHREFYDHIIEERRRKNER